MPPFPFTELVAIEQLIESESWGANAALDAPAIIETEDLVNLESATIEDSRKPANTRTRGGRGRGSGLRGRGRGGNGVSGADGSGRGRVGARGNGRGRSRDGPESAPPKA